MNINTSLTGPQNIIALATDSAFTAPTNPSDVGVGIPLPYPPPNPNFRLQGVNVDGSNSNTMVKVFVRAKLEDVNEDGENQTIAYRRVTLTSLITGTHTVNLTHEMTQAEALASAAQQLGLVASEVTWVAFSELAGTMQIQASLNSLLYLPSMITVSIVYAG